MSTFPTTIDTNYALVAGVTTMNGTAAGVSAKGTDVVNELSARTVNLETKVGVDSSAVATSLDYILKNTTSGHNHSGAGTNGPKLPLTSLVATTQVASTFLQIDSGPTNVVASKAVPTGVVVGDTDAQTLTTKTISSSSKLDTNADQNFTLYDMDRNAVINGNMDFMERFKNASFSKANPANATYVMDYWKTSITNTGTLPTTITHTRQQQTAGDIANSFYFYRIAPNGAGSGFGTSDLYTTANVVEFGTRYLCGASRKVTLSFWAKSSIASKKLGYAFGQNYGTGGSPTAEETIAGSSVTLTSSWTKYTITVTTNTLVGKTFGTNLDDSFRIYLFHMWGTTTGSTYGLGASTTFTGSGNIDIAQVQLCAGDAALPFHPRHYAQELFLCQRSYRIASFNGQAFNTTDLLITCPFIPNLRITPALANITVNSKVDGSGTDGNVDRYGTGNVAITPTTVDLFSNAGFRITASAAPFNTNSLYDGSLKVDVGL